MVSPAAEVEVDEGLARALLHEQRWLPSLAPSLPLPVPAPTYEPVGRRSLDHALAHAARRTS